MAVKIKYKALVIYIARKVIIVVDSGRGSLQVGSV